MVKWYFSVLISYDDQSPRILKQTLDIETTISKNKVLALCMECVRFIGSGGLLEEGADRKILTKARKSTVFKFIKRKLLT